MTTKGLILDRLRLSMSINGVRIIFPNLVQSRTFAKDIQGQASSHLQIRVILYHVELNTCSSFFRSNTRFTSPQSCHMLLLDQVKHRSINGTIQALNSFNFHKWAHKTWGMTRCTKHVLSKGCMYTNQFLPWIARMRGMSYKWEGASTHIWEIQYAQLIPYLAKPILIQWLGEYVGKLIFGAHTLNANIPFLLMIYYKIVTDINVLCSCMLNQIVGELDSTLIVT
jgi:hypothetical protein